MLEQGHIAKDATATEAVDHYLTTSTKVSNVATQLQRPGSGDWRFTQVLLDKSTYDPGESINATFTLSPQTSDAPSTYLSGLLFNDREIAVCQLDSRLVGTWVHDQRLLTGSLKIDGITLKPGEYRLDLYVCTPMEIVDLFSGAATFSVSELLPYPATAGPDAVASGAVLANFSWCLQATSNDNLHESN
ncbi:MAG: hypothetical protein QM775_13065 [Pirellulales bacterium]